VVRVRVDKVVAEGDGLGRLDDGRVVFVEGALPGELVEIEIVRQSRDYARAKVTSVIEPNADRVEPPCPHVARGCGGCDLQHASVSLQRRIKRDIVVESLTRIAKFVEPEVRAVVDELPSEGWRSSLRVAVDAEGRVGFRRRRSNDVLAVDRCLVADRRLDRSFTSAFTSAFTGAFTGAPAGWGGVEEISLRVGDDDHVSAWADPTIGSADDRIAITVDGAVLRVSSASFFQSSARGAAALSDVVRRALGDPSGWPEGPFLDAYGGIGLFSRTVAPDDRRVILVEANPFAVADARANLDGRSTRGRNTVFAGRFEDWTPEPVAVAVADPSRDGLRAAAVEVLRAAAPATLALVSCDPASLGRDARLLVENGFEFEWSEVVDLFPHTHHVEVVSRFVSRDRL